MRVVPILALALVVTGCKKSEETPTDTATTTTTTTTDPDGWANHAFETGTSTGCSTDIAWNTWTYDGGTPVATIVFSHGRTEYTDKYHRMVEDLQDQPWNWVIWDQYGHGRSGGIRAHATDLMAEHVCDLDTIIDELVDPNLPLVHASHSTGGLASALWIQQNQGRTAAAVFGSPLFGLSEKDNTEPAQCQIAGLSVSGGLSENLADKEYPNPRPDCLEWGATHDCEFYDEFRSDPLTEVGGATWGWLNAVCDGLDSLRVDFNLIDAPTVILRGALDTSVNLESFDPLCDGITAGCEIQEHPDDWHEIWHELDRDVAQQALIDLVETSI